MTCGNWCEKFPTGREKRKENVQLKRRLSRLLNRHFRLFLTAFYIEKMQLDVEMSSPASNVWHLNTYGSSSPFGKLIDIASTSQVFKFATIGASVTIAVKFQNPSYNTF